MGKGEAPLGPVGLPSVGPWLIGCAVASQAISFGTIHRDQHADSILNILISLQHWTPFVWEQDRFGMLIPWLARPIEHPLANLLFQSSLAIFSGLTAFFLLARYAFRSTLYPAIGTIGAASILTLTPPYFRFEYLIDTSYGLSLSLALWGLILLEPGWIGVSRSRLLAAIVLVLLAHWVNCVTAIFLGPFVILRWLLESSLPWRCLDQSGQAGNPSWIRVREGVDVFSKGETALALVFLAVGYAAGQAMIALNPIQHTDLAALPPSEWLSTWGRLLRAYGVGSNPPYWAALMGLEAGVALLVLWRRMARTRNGLPALALVATAVVLWLLLGTRVWIVMNNYAFRYLFPSALMIQTAVAGLALSAIETSASTRARARRAFAVGPTLVLLTAATWSYGLPSISNVRRDLDGQFGALTEDLLAAGCRGLAGDYWRVWPAVFHANLTLYEAGDRRPFLGFTFRCAPTFGLWKDTPGDRRRIGIARVDGLGDGFIRSYFPGKARELEARRTIRVVSPFPR